MQLTIGKETLRSALSNATRSPCVAYASARAIRTGPMGPERFGKTTRRVVRIITDRDVDLHPIPARGSPHRWTQYFEPENPIPAPYIRERPSDPLRSPLRPQLLENGWNPSAELDDRQLSSLEWMIDREKEIKPFVKECKCIRQWPFTGFSCEISLRWGVPDKGGNSRRGIRLRKDSCMHRTFLAARRRRDSRCSTSQPHGALERRNQQIFASRQSNSNHERREG